MKKTTITLLFVLTVFIGTTAFIIKSKHSAGFAGYTNSPSESNCGSCHSGGSAISSGVTVSAVPAFTNNNYIPSTTYTITLSVSATGFNNYGFGCEILNAGNSDAGTMQNPSSGVKFLTAGNGRKNAVQTATKNGTGSTTFSFEWIAPASGTVTLFSSVCAVNANNNTTGDFAFTNNLVLSDAQNVGIKENNPTTISGIMIFPNPATDFATVFYDLKETQQITIQLVNLNGKIIKEFLNEKQFIGEYSKIINLQNIDPGVYFIKLSNANTLLSQKLISIQ